MSALDDLNEILTLRKMVYDLRSENERLKEAVEKAEIVIKKQLADKIAFGWMACNISDEMKDWLSKYGAKDADATKEAGSLEWS